MMGRQGHVRTLLSATDIVVFLVEMDWPLSLTVIVIDSVTIFLVTPEALRREAFPGWRWTPDKGIEPRVVVELLKLIEHLKNIGSGGKGR